MPCPYKTAAGPDVMATKWARGRPFGYAADRRGRIISAVAQTDPDMRLWGRIGRRSIRLAGHDYRQPGAYFVTICAKARAPRFGDIRSGLVRLNRAGLIAHRLWLAIPRHFAHVRLDEFVIMPDHMHGILVFRAAPDDLPRPRRFGDAVPGSLSTIIGAYKAEVTKRVNALRNTHEQSVWQRNFYQHVIRSRRALQAIRTYIRGNPRRWTDHHLK
jgi:putative transposase